MVVSVSSVPTGPFGGRRLVLPSSSKGRVRRTRPVNRLVSVSSRTLFQERNRETAHSGRPGHLSWGTCCSTNTVANSRASISPPTVLGGTRLSGPAKTCHEGKTHAQFSFTVSSSLVSVEFSYSREQMTSAVLRFRPLYDNEASAGRKMNPDKRLGTPYFSSVL